MKIESVRLIDWHDGPVAALIRVREDRRWLYCGLVAWNMDRRQRLFLATDLPQALADRLLAAMPEDVSSPAEEWEPFNRVMREAELRWDEPVWVLRYQDPEVWAWSGPVDLTPGEADSVGDLEASIPEARWEHWHSRFLDGLQEAD